MRKYGNIIYFFVFVICMFLMVMFIDVSPGKLFTNIYIPQGLSKEQTDMIKQYYSFDFDTKTAKKQSLPIFMPVYKNCSPEQAVLYAQLFGFNVLPDETENEFIFAADSAVLTVDKYLSKLNYSLNEILSGSNIKTVSINISEALELASEFLRERFPLLYFENCVCVNENGFFICSYGNSLSGLPLYDFQTSVKISESGLLVSCVLFFSSFEKIDSCGVMNPEECAYLLPKPTGRVTLEKAELCYIFSHSIVQPAYRFEGHLETGEIFVEYVCAASYN